MQDQCAAFGHGRVGFYLTDAKKLIEAITSASKRVLVLYKTIFIRTIAMW